jgi:hypothetical protein
MKSLSKKIFLTLFTGIIIIVFGAWGMGDLFSGGNKNIIATVDNKKIFVQDFITNARLLLQQKQKNNLDDQDYNYILNRLISEKIYEILSSDLDLKVSDQALATYIKSNKEFQDQNGDFSRTQYEKYLLLNNLNSQTVEFFLKKELVKKIATQSFINGVTFTNYHKKNLENDFLKQVSAEYIKINSNKTFSENEIKNYFADNEKQFSLGQMRSGKTTVLDYKNLGFQNENDEYYKMLNNIENDIISNISFEEIIKKYNLKTQAVSRINKAGLNLNYDFSKKKQFANALFSLNENLNTEIFEINKKKYLVKLDEIYENGKTNLNEKIKNQIIEKLNFKEKKEIAKIVINNNNFDENKNQITEVFFKDISDNQKLFNNENMVKIFNMKIGETFSINENKDVYVIKIKNFSKKNKKIENLETIIENQVINNFQSLILQSLDDYLLKRYPIKINEKVLNQIKKNI